MPTLTQIYRSIKDIDAVLLELVITTASDKLTEQQHAAVDEARLHTYCAASSLDRARRGLGPIKRTP